MSWRESIDLVMGLLSEHKSHFVTALREWEWPMELHELALVNLAEGWMNAHRDEKKQKKPFEYPKPWQAQEKPKFTEEDRRVAEEALARATVWQ